MCDEPLSAGQRDIYGVRVTTKIVSRFKQRDIGFALQRMSCCQPRNAGANDGDAGRRAGGHQRAEDKNVAKRPDANKGGREEENRSGIASKAKRLRRLRNNETGTSQQFTTYDGVILMVNVKFLISAWRERKFLLS